MAENELGGGMNTNKINKLKPVIIRKKRPPSTPGVELVIFRKDFSLGIFNIIYIITLFVFFCKGNFWNLTYEPSVIQCVAEGFCLYVVQIAKRRPKYA